MSTSWRAKGVVGVVSWSLVAAACTTALVDPTSTTEGLIATPSTTVATSPTTTTTTSSTTTTRSVEPDWPAHVAERHIENFLATLQAGQFDVAGWVMDLEGGAYADQRGDETAGEYLARSCGQDRCVGEYSISDPIWTGTDVIQGEWEMTVTHVATGNTTTVAQGFHEGQPIVIGLPPLIPSDPAPGLVERLFGLDAPEDVVVSRYNAFEVWDRGAIRWLSHPWAGYEQQVEGGYLTALGRVVKIDDPTEIRDYECPRLLERSGRLLVHDRCVADEPGLFDLVTGSAADWILGPKTGRDEIESWGWLERGGSLVEYYGDAEGNLSGAFSANGRDLIGDDYPGIAVLSTDGRWFVYVDHREGLSHFWSDVVVVRRVTDGMEMGRWALGEIVTCLEASGDWIIACLTPESAVSDIDFDGRAHVALAAIHVPSGEVTVVDTRALVYLPVTSAD